MVEEREILVTLIKSECTVSNIQTHQFPELSTATFSSSDIRITTDFNNKYFPLLETLKSKNSNEITIDAVIFKGPGDLLDPQYTYVMQGDLYEITQKDGFSLYKISFGGMLMELEADLNLEKMDEIGLGLRIIINQ